MRGLGEQRERIEAAMAPVSQGAFALLVSLLWGQPVDPVYLERGTLGSFHVQISFFLMPSHSHSYVEISNFSVPAQHFSFLLLFIELPAAYTALIFPKHFAKIVEALRDNLCEASKLVATEALRHMKRGDCNLQREPSSRLEVQ